MSMIAEIKLILDKFFHLSVSFYRKYQKIQISIIFYNIR